MGLAAASRPEQENVRLLQLDVVAPDAGGLLVLDPPVVVVDRDGQDLLGVVLTDDVIVEERPDLRGLGRWSNVSSAGSASSSSMISLHRSMHSSQMYTPGPAMSLRTCFCDLPQNEHLSSSPVSPNLATSLSFSHAPVG